MSDLRDRARELTRVLAELPPRGWNSWNQFGTDVTAYAICETATALVQHGLSRLGYEYVVIDDGWSRRSGRSASGDLVPDPDRFPHGMAPVAEHVHRLGLKLGIYSDAAETTCGGYPGSLGYEEQDARLWASWGVDFLKYDYCGAPDDQNIARERYATMGRALAGTGREILYSVCEWGGRAPHLWGPELGAQMWRVTPDLFDSWVDITVPGTDPAWTGIGVDTSLDLLAELAGYGGPGGWNDLDMLVVGLQGQGSVHGPGMSMLEYQTHMTMWSMACSPLMIGCDVRSLDPPSRDLLTNREVLAVNHDPLGIPARRARRIGASQLWVKPAADGSVAVALVNRGSSPETVPLRARDAGLLDAGCSVRDLWAGEDLPRMTREVEYTVEAHQTRLLRLRPC